MYIRTNIRIGWYMYIRIGWYMYIRIGWYMYIRIGWYMFEESIVVRLSFIGSAHTQCRPICRQSQCMDGDYEYLTNILFLSHPPSAIRSSQCLGVHLAQNDDHRKCVESSNFDIIMASFY